MDGLQSFSPDLITPFLDSLDISKKDYYNYNVVTVSDSLATFCRMVQNSAAAAIWLLNTAYISLRRDRRHSFVYLWLVDRIPKHQESDCLKLIQLGRPLEGD